MSFQWIFDNAASISINKKGVVATTTSRDGTVRATSRGGQVWRFDVRLPDGPRWQDYRSFIAASEYLDRHTVDTVSLSASGYTDYLNNYLGDAPNTSAIQCTIPSSGNTITLTSGQATNGFNFRAGDIIQLGASGSVYEVVADVAWDSNTVTLHRPLLDSADTGVTLRVGPACEFTVQCVEFPNWTIFARDQVSWSGSFVFYESLV